VTAKRVTFWISTGLMTACFLYMALTYSALPETIVVHFDARGQPDGWSDKSAFFVQYSLIVLGINLLMVGLLPFLIRRVPESMVNLPQKEYWFSAPQRKERIYNRLAVMFHAIGIHTNLIFLVCYQMIIQASFPEVAFQIHVGGFLVLVVVTSLMGTVVFLLFLSPPKEEGTEQ